VDCHTVFDNVFSIRLRDNNLSGTIPPELGSLSMMRTLDLADNGLTGSIPPELEDVTLLRDLDLYENQLTGSIPSELANLSTLEDLKLGKNQLTGTIPPELGTLSSLTRLHLGWNQLTGTIPAELGDLTSLSGSLRLNDNQLTGNIPPELGNLVDLTYLNLNDNQLSGSIPPELGDLVDLWWLHLQNNQLTGTIPPELAGLPVVEQLYLSSNQLEGSIPPEFGTMTAPVSLSLSNNRLSGSIPPELGNMTAVLGLYLTSNQLSGEIPTNLMGLSTLMSMGLSYNSLYSSSPALVAFLEEKHHYDVLWKMSQTVAPENPMVAPPPFPVGDHTIWLMWSGIDYQMDPGGYEVFSSPSGSGVWTSGGWNDNKADPVFPVTGLDPGTTYDLAVASYTDPHTYNQNLLTSDLSTSVTMTTANAGCGQPVITATGMGPFTLSLTESYDSYAWNTMETTPTIVVDPTSQTWYTVAVTSGACSEAAVISVAPIGPLIFSDGFESGDTTEWSSSVP
jgi:Leucine-rich repeat (LRR) protein